MSAIAYGQVFGRKFNNEQRVIDEPYVPLGKKLCLRCHKVRDEREFPPIKGAKGKRMDVCKTCLELGGEIIER